MRPGDPNLAMLELMAEKLGTLTEQLVFVGGCTTGLFISDPLLPPVRAARITISLRRPCAASVFRRTCAPTRRSVVGRPANWCLT